MAGIQGTASPTSPLLFNDMVGEHPGFPGKNKGLGSPGTKTVYMYYVFYNIFLSTIWSTARAKVLTFMTPYIHPCMERGIQNEYV